MNETFENIEALVEKMAAFNDIMKNVATCDNSSTPTVEKSSGRWKGGFHNISSDFLFSCGDWRDELKWDDGETETASYLITLLTSPSKLGLKKHVIRFIKSKSGIVEDSIRNFITSPFGGGFHKTVQTLVESKEIKPEEVKYMYILKDTTERHFTKYLYNRGGNV